MKKDKEKIEYESPRTKKTQVNLESGICAGSADIQNPNENNGRIEEHKINDDFNFSFTDQDWDTPSNN